MNLHEYQAKELLKKYNVPVQEGIPVETPEAAAEAYKQLRVQHGGGFAVVKAQIHAGGRGKGTIKGTEQHGVAVGKNAEEIKTIARNILGGTLVTVQTGAAGKKVNKVLVAQDVYYPGPNPVKEFYLSVLLDRAKGRNVIMYSTEGGMDIEDVAAKTPEKIFKEWVHPGAPLQAFQARKIAFNLGLSGQAFKNMVRFVMNLYHAYIELECSMLEINPLFKTSDDKILAVDCKMKLDDNALMRHPDLEALRDITEEDPTEVEAGKYNLNFVKLDGNVGCMVNGAGLAMATMDMIKLSGGEPANKLLPLKYRVLIILLFYSCTAAAQIGRPSGGLGNNPFSQERSSDSLNRPHKHVEDSIKIHYRYLDDVKDRSLDTSISDFYQYLPLHPDDIYLGNLGTPTHPLIYKPDLKPGWDAGFHVLDDYRLTLDSTRYYNTPRPYTVLEYLVGSKQEQMIDAFHTQNPRENINFGFHYRKISSPGYFRNQNANDDSYNIFVHYNTKNKRYNAYASFVANKLNVGENGGIRDVSLLTDPDYEDRRTIGVHLGGNSPFSFGFFSASIATKSSYKETGFLFRHQYDWGRGDTIRVNDTTQRYEFNPVFRIEHTLRLQKISAGFTDTIPDSAAVYYGMRYGLDHVIGGGNILADHSWNVFSNDLSLVQFPVRGNQAHFIKAGATFENVRGDFLYNAIRFSNLRGHFEYHNRTKNEKWELDALGQLYLAGNNFGDYKVSGSLSRYLNERLGDVKIAFTNLNQTPSFVYRFFQSNRFLSVNKDLKKSNTTLLQFAANNRELKYHLAANYYLLTNYTYFKNYTEADQYATVFNLLQLVASKQFTWGHFNWYLDLAYQQTGSAAPLHVPLFWTRDRFTYEGVFFKNLVWCSGVELRYNTPYYADDYSPVLQQFVSQRDEKLGNKYPDAAVFVHFRIKTFVAYVRAENLNTFVGRNIIQAPGYPYPDFAIRVGLKWGYIN